MIDSSLEGKISTPQGLIFNHSYLYGDAPTPAMTEPFRKRDVREVDPEDLNDLFRKIISKNCSQTVDWKGDEDDEWFDEIVNDIANWQLARLGLPVSSKWPTHKGIILAGKCGTGKSLLMTSLRKWQIEINRLYIVPDEFILGSKLYSETDVVMGISNGATIRDLLHNINGLFLDDFGRVSKMKYYGTDIYPSSEVVEEYWRKWEHGASCGYRERYTIYGTTNLLPNADDSKNQLLNYLGAKAYDRLRQMAIIKGCNRLKSHRI